MLARSTGGVQRLLRKRGRHRSLLQRMPQPQQPMLQTTMANTMRWTGGSAEPASAAPDRDTESAKSASPDGGKQLGENLEEPESGPSSRSTTYVPVVLWPNLGAQRPRTPSRSPRRRPARQPSARAVQLVQEHMRACRQRRSQMRTH